MALTLVQSKTATGSSATASATLSPAATAGNLIVIRTGGDFTASTPSGFTQAGAGIQSAAHYQFYKIAAGGETTISVTYGGSTAWSIQVTEYSGNPGSSPLDAAGSTNGGTNATNISVTTSGSVSADGEAGTALAGNTQFDDNPTHSFSNSFTLDYESNATHDTATAYRDDPPSGSTLSTTDTYGGSSGNNTGPGAVLGVYKGSGGPPPPPDLIEDLGTGTPVAGTTSITTAAYPSGWDADTAAVDAGQVKIVCTVASNHTTTPQNTPTVSGFTEVGSLEGGGGTQGTGAGPRRLTFFERTATSGDDTTPSVSLTSGNVMVAAFSAFQTVGSWETSAAAMGAETTAGLSWSAGLDSDPGLDVDDMLVLGCAVRDTCGSTDEGITATGATFGSVSEAADLSSETGNDIALHVATCLVTSGPNSATPTRTATHSTSETGVVGVLRLRATDVSSTDLVVDAAAHGHTAVSASLTQTHELAVNSATQGHVSASPALTQLHELVAQGAVHVLTSASPALVVDLVAQAATHAHTAASPALTQAHTLSVDGATQAQSAGSAALTQTHVLVVDAAGHAQSADSPTLNTSTDLAVQDAAHSQSAGSPALTQTHVLAVGAASQAQAADNVDLSGAATLAVADAVQAQAAGNVTLTQTHALSVDAVSHAQTSATPTLAQTHVLVVDGATHGQSAENVPVGAGLAVNDATHGQSCGNVTLTQVHVLVVQGATHAHAAGSVALGQVHLLTVAAAMHAHIAQNATVIDATITWVNRPYVGVTARPYAGVTARPDSGVTVRPRIPYEP